MSFVTFFPCSVLHDHSGHVRRPIAIWAGNTESQMKQRGGSSKSRVTKRPVKAQEQRSAATSSLAVSPSKLAQEGSSHSYFLSGDDSPAEVWGKITFFHVWMYSSSQGRANVLWLCSRVLLWADDMSLQRHSKNVNSDRDRAVVVETPMMGLLVWLKVKTKEDKELF